MNILFCDNCFTPLTNAHQISYTDSDDHQYVSWLCFRCFESDNKFKKREVRDENLS